MRLTDAFGDIAGNRPGYVFDTQTDNEHRTQTRDFQKAQLSAEWKGGLADGDLVKFAGRTMEVLGYSDAGKVRLADASEVDANTIKQQAYDEYKTDLSEMWSKGFPHSRSMHEGGSCAINGALGRYEKKNGKLVCVKLPDKYDRNNPQSKPGKYKEPSDNEWAIAGQGCSTLITGPCMRG